MSRVES